MTRQRATQRAGPVPITQIPQVDGPIVAGHRGSRQGAPARGECCGDHSSAVAVQWCTQLTRPIPMREIPQDDGFVVAGGREGVPVRRKHHRRHRICVAGQWLAQTAGPVPISQITQDDGSAVTPDGHGAPVQGEGYRIHLACGVVLVVELTLFLALRERFIAVSHGVAAVTMVAGSSRCWGSARCAGRGRRDARRGPNRDPNRLEPPERPTNVSIWRSPRCPLTWGAGEAQVKRGRVNLALSVLLRTGARRGGLCWQA